MVNSITKQAQNCAQAASQLDGGITAPTGYLAAGDHIGIKNKPEKKDLSILFSEVPAGAAAVFTANVVKAAPILWCREALSKNSRVQAVVVNSGNANACTGQAGLVHARQMAEVTAQCFKLEPCEVLVASTGVIGVPMPIEKILAGIKNVARKVESSASAAHDAACGIMTTDITCKEIAYRTQIGGKSVTFGGMAKGSGMIHPNMATMLGFITTDANIAPALLQQALKESAARTYNMISVDGDTSTNDMAVILANGLADNPLIDQPGKDYDLFTAALDHVNTYLAKSIAADGEGATKLLEVRVSGAKTVDDARKLARSVISSSLVKSAFFGHDANWGRVLCALGYAGAAFDPAKLSIEFVSRAGSICLIREGEPMNFDEEIALGVIKEHDVRIVVTMNEGKAEATAWGCDLSYDYVRINAAYRT